ncbi:MAG: hypothetical protein CMF43_05700 [Legionellales bacterium]|nr:hypothetical protein [Legionellales bacterium]
MTSLRYSSSHSDRLESYSINKPAVLECGDNTYQKHDAFLTDLDYHQVLSPLGNRSQESSYQDDIGNDNDNENSRNSSPNG